MGFSFIALAEHYSALDIARLDLIVSKNNSQTLTVLHIYHNAWCLRYKTQYCNDTKWNKLYNDIEMVLTHID